MRSLLQTFRAATAATAFLVLAGCVLHPAAVLVVARIAFPDAAAGSLVRDRSGEVRGSTRIGQRFTGTRHFQPRPSAAGADGYDAMASGGSNLGPSSRRLAEQVGERVAAYRARNGLAPGTPVPADAVTASASGLDPHISPRNAAMQLPRVARERGLSEEAVRRLVECCTESFGTPWFGEPGVNVLRLNLALDEP